MFVNRAALRHLRNGLILAFAWTIGSANAAVATDIERQRALFISVYKMVERGDWSVVQKLPLADQRLLSEYVLWPDLRAAFFRATLGNSDSGAVESFLSQYGVLRPARDLRYRYALHLAKAGDLSSYLTIYQQFYQGLENARLDCLGLRAELAAGRQARIINRATHLWMVGSSQVDECDPVFAYLDDQQILGPADYAKRYALAIEAREFSLALWLAKSIDQQHIDTAKQWLAAQGNPVTFASNHKQLPRGENSSAQLAYAIERITYSDPEQALSLWRAVTRSHRFSAAQEIRTARHIALWTARDGLVRGYALLKDLPAAAQNDEVLRWRARTSLRDGHWARLVKDIALMSADERASEEWRYWRGVALQRTHRNDESETVLAELARERSYYGFLAADELGLTYALNDVQIDADEAVISALTDRPELVRARELLLVGLDSRARSEWDAVVSYLQPEQKRQAARLASLWGWHSRAISAAASAGDYDDLSLRYPLPFQETFREHADSASISATWAYGIARSESLFMRDVRSSAGAIGLMQLMPATGRMVAQQLSVPYAGLDTLTNPQDNIRLGTSYLGQMAARYGGNRVLATAAYNAGPHRVDRWLPDSGTIDARIWIENIPFNETRKYVRRVMAADTIFHWRMTGNIRRLSDELLLVRAASGDQQLASR